MPDTLYIRFNATDDSVDWVVVTTDGATADVGRGALSDAAVMADSRRVVALAPVTSVLKVRASIPLKGNAKIRQALPFALEEQVAGKIEAQHFAFRKADADGKIPVAIIESELLEDWLTSMTDAGIKPDAIYAATDGLVAMPATMSVLLDGDDAIILDQHGDYTVTDAASLQTILELLLDQHSESMENDATTVPISLIIYCSEQEHDDQAEMWERLRMRAENVEIKILADGALAWLATQIPAAPTINLLQGAYTPKTEINIDWGPWKIPAALAAGLVLMVFVLQGAQYWQLSRAEAALDNAALELLQTTFPDAGTGGDPWNTLQSRLGASSGGDAQATVGGPGFAAALESLATAFAATPDLSMQTLAYRSGILDLQLLAPNVDSLDQLRQKIGDSGKFEANIQSANPDKDVIKGRMQITLVTE